MFLGPCSAPQVVIKLWSYILLQREQMLNMLGIQEFCWGVLVHTFVSVVRVVLMVNRSVCGLEAVFRQGVSCLHSLLFRRFSWIPAFACPVFSSQSLPQGALSVCSSLLCSCPVSGTDGCLQIFLFHELCCHPVQSHRQYVWLMGRKTLR